MAAVYNPLVYRGRDYDLQLTFVRPAVPSTDPPVPIDYTSFTFAAQLRRYPDDSLVADWTVDDTNIATGVVVVSLTHDDTADLSGLFSWDLKVTGPTGDVATYVIGTVTVTETTTL